MKYTNKGELNSVFLKRLRYMLKYLLRTFVSCAGGRRNHKNGKCCSNRFQVGYQRCWLPRCWDPGKLCWTDVHYLPDATKCVLARGWKLLLWIRHLHTNVYSMCFNPNRWNVRPQDRTLSYINLNLENGTSYLCKHCHSENWQSSS